MLLLLALSGLALSSGGRLLANETEILAVASVQAGPSLSAFKTELFNLVEFSNQFQGVPGIFSQQDGDVPPDGEVQLPLFGAKMPWPRVMAELTSASDRVLLIMIRHGEAWENVNPLSNDFCQFPFEGRLIDNLDSALDDVGVRQAADLNALLKSGHRSDGTNSTRSWFETLGLKNKPFLSSPLTRTLQTSKYALDGLPIPRVVGTEIVRASIGHDVCNFRRSVLTPTSLNDLPAPFSTSCALPPDSLTELYVAANPPSGLAFEFPIRPQGGAGFGLLSDADTLWRADVEDNTHVTRATAFLAQVFENKEFFSDANSDIGSIPVVGLVTHGETIDAIYKAAGESGYSPKNTQVVPLMIDRLVS